ncbi:MAG: T9SS type A sorting domain-containing protein [Rhodothermaceae bacterium]
MAFQMKKKGVVKVLFLFICVFTGYINAQNFILSNADGGYESYNGKYLKTAQLINGKNVYQHETTSTYYIYFITDFGGVWLIDNDQNKNNNALYSKNSTSNTPPLGMWDRYDAGGAAPTLSAAPTFPVITSATYNAATGLLTVSGSDLVANAGADNDIDVSKLTITGEGGSRQLTASSDVELTSSTEFQVTLNVADKVYVDMYLNKNGTSSSGGITFNLAAEDDFNAGHTADNTVDPTNTLTAGSVPLPVITSAEFNSTTGVLLLKGTGFKSKAGANNDVDADLLSITGEGNVSQAFTDTPDADIVPNTSDGTYSASLTLSTNDKGSIPPYLNKEGFTSLSGTTYNLSAGEDWNTGADAALTIISATNGIEVKSLTAPDITAVSYNQSTRVVTVTGTHFKRLAGNNNDIDVSQISFKGEDDETFTLSTTSDAELTSATEFSFTIDAAEAAQINTFLNKNGTASTSGTTYELSALSGWNKGVASSGADTEGITVSNVQLPQINSVAYDCVTGVITATGANFKKKAGSDNDINALGFIFTGEGGGTHSVSGMGSVCDITSATEFSFPLTYTQKDALNTWFNKNGTASKGGTSYNLSVPDNWNTGADVALDIADATAAVTVSNVEAPVITKAGIAGVSSYTVTYHVTDGKLYILGRNFKRNAGANNDIDASKIKLKGEGGVIYTLTDTPDPEMGFEQAVTDPGSQKTLHRLTVTLSNTDKNALIDIMTNHGLSATDGTVYNLEVEDDWMPGAPDGTDISDLTTEIDVTGMPKPIVTSVSYDAATGVLTVTGNRFKKAAGANNDIVPTEFTFRGEGGAGSEFTLAATSGGEITDRTSFTLTLAGGDKSSVNALLNKNGTTSLDGTTYNLFMDDPWNNSANDELTTNGVTVSNVPKPEIISATYNATTGILVVTGSNLLAKTGSANDITASKFTITGKSNLTHTLAATSDTEITSETKFTLTLGSADKLAVNNLFDKEGNVSGDGVTYNLAAAEDWNAGAAAAMTIADLTGNPIDAEMNKAPSGGSKIFDLNEDTTKVFTVNDFSYYDENGDPLDHILISNITGTNKVYLDANSNDTCDVNETIQNGDQVSGYFIKKGKLKFSPEKNSFGDNYQTFDFKVFDGKVYCTETYTLTLNVKSVYDAPIGKNVDIILTEDSSYTFRSTNFYFTDIENGRFLGIKIIAAPGRGELKYEDNSVVEGTYYSDVAKLVYHPEKDAYGNNHTTFAFKIKSSTGLFSIDTNYITVNIQGVNDEPVISTLPGITFKEDSCSVINCNDLKQYVTDSDNKWEELELKFSCVNNHLSLTNLTDTTLMVSSEAEWCGSSQIKLVVSDGEFSSEGLFNVLVSDVNDKIDTTQVPDSVDVDFDESDVINIYDLVDDPDTPDSLLTFEIKSSCDSINCCFDKTTGELKLNVAEGFTGKAYLTVTVTDTDGQKVTFTINLNLMHVTDVINFENIPTQYSLNQNYPNPFNPATVISFGVPEESKVVIEIFNILGEKIETIKNETLTSGNYKVKWNASNLPSGIYLYRINAVSVVTGNMFIETKKMLFVK